MEVILPFQDASYARPKEEGSYNDAVTALGSAVSVPAATGAGAVDFKTAATEDAVTIDSDVVFKFMNTATAVEIMTMLMLYIFGDLKFGVRAKPGKEPQGDALQRGQSLMNNMEKYGKMDQVWAATFPDLCGWGSGFIEYAFGPVPDGVQLPTLFQWLPSYSFTTQPSSKQSTEYRFGKLLKGVMISRKENKYEYWQTPDPVNASSTNIQIQDSENGGLIHIKDIGSSFPDGRSYMISVIEDFYDLVLARRKLMQAGNRMAGAFFTVKLDPTEIVGKEALILPNNDSKATLKGYYEKIEALSKTIVKKVSTSTSAVLYPGMKLESPNVQIALDPMMFHKYIKTGILQHFIPRHIIETEGNSLTSTGASILEILEKIASGWRRVYNPYMQQIADKTLEKNGLLDLESYIIWPAIKEEDKQVIFDRAIAAIEAMLIPPTRFMTLVGWDQLTDQEKTELDEYWKQRQANGVV